MKAITFTQFMLTYNFRYYREDCKEDTHRMNTSCIRIEYPIGSTYPKGHEWIEFGMYDYGGNDYKLEQLKNVFNEKILDLYVSDFYYDDDLEIFVVRLSEEQYIDEVE